MYEFHAESIMPGADKKEQVLLKLRHRIKTLLEQGPARKSEIYRILNKSFSNDKALLRLLTKMVEDGDIVGAGNSSAYAYSLPNHNNQSATSSFMMPLPVVPSELIAQSNFAAYRPFLNSYFSQAPSLRGWKGYDQDRILKYVPNESQLLSNETILLLRNNANLEITEDLGATYEGGVTKTFMQQFSFNSSRLEGVVSDLADTLSIIDHPDSHQDNEQKIIVLNHKRAIDLMVPWILNEESGFMDNLQAGPGPIMEIHSILMEGLLKDDNEGMIRDHTVVISKSSYKPMNNPDALMHELKAIASKAGTIADPFERSFFLMTQISYLQAFTDGNKRTGRLISNAPLIASGRPPHVFAGITEDDYHMAIVFYYETGDPRPLEKLWLESYLEGVSHFEISKKDMRATNLDKARLSSARWGMIAEIVRGLRPLSRSEAPAMALKHLKTHGLDLEYTATDLLTQIDAGLKKLEKTSIGSKASSLTEHEIETWRKTSSKLLRHDT